MVRRNIITGIIIMDGIMAAIGTAVITTIMIVIS